MKSSPLVTWALLLGLATPVAAQQADPAAGVEAAPSDPEHYEALGRGQLKQGDLDGAIATYRALVNTVPGYAMGRYRLAFALRKAGRLDEAAAAYRAYVEVAPSDPDGYFGLARTLEKLGQVGEARGAYSRYIELEKRPSEAKWVEQARARIAAIDQMPPAPATLSPPPAATPIPPATVAPPVAAAPAPSPAPVAEPNAELLADSPLARATPAADPDAAFVEGRYAEAAQGYLAAAGPAADAAGLYYKAAVAAAAAGDPIAARAAALAAVRTDPTWPPSGRVARISAAEIDRLGAARYAGIEQALAEGRLRTAARLALQALERADGDADRAALHWARGRALARLGRFDEAMVALKRAAARYPADPNLWADLGIVSARRGDSEAARSFLAIAAAVAPAGHPIGGDAQSSPRTNPTEAP